MSLRVIVVDLASRGLADAIEAAGFQVAAHLRAEEDLYDRVRALKPDAVIIDADSPRRDTLEHLGNLGRRYPRPTVLLSEHGRPDVVGAAASVGISAYLVEGLSGSLVRSLVEVAVYHFRGNQALHDELARTRRRLEERTVVDRAKCLLMEREGLSESDAYHRLRRLAMNRSQSLAKLSEEILRAVEAG